MSNGCWGSVLFACHVRSFQATGGPEAVKSPLVQKTQYGGGVSSFRYRYDLDDKFVFEWL